MIEIETEADAEAKRVTLQNKIEAVNKKFVTLEKRADVLMGVTIGMLLMLAVIFLSNIGIFAWMNIEK